MFSSSRLFSIFFMLWKVNSYRFVSFTLLPIECWTRKNQTKWPITTNKHLIHNHLINKFVDYLFTNCLLLTHLREQAIMIKRCNFHMRLQIEIQYFTFTKWNIFEFGILIFIIWRKKILQCPLLKWSWFNGFQLFRIHIEFYVYMFGSLFPFSSRKQ